MPPFKFQQHTRYELYELWLDARAIRLHLSVPPVGSFVVDPGFDPASRKRFFDGMKKLSDVERWEFIEGGALFNAASDALALLGSKGFVAEPLLKQCVSGCERVLGVVAISQAHLSRYSFASDPTPLDMEQDLLSVALQIDEDLVNGETHFVKELAQAAHVEESAVRRIVCRWMDDRIAYMHDDALDDDREPFLLEDRAQRRLDNWRSYEESRMNRFDFVIEVERPFPLESERLVHGIGRELGLTFQEVHPASKGFAVWGWCRDTTPDALGKLREELIARVRATFAEERRHEIAVTPSSTTIHNYSAQQVGAQGPGAIASHNTMTLTQQMADDDVQVLLAELATLRDYLLNQGVTSTADALEVAALVEAEEAAKAKEPGLITAALKKLGAKAIDALGPLGLTAVRAWIAAKLGSSPALPPGG